MAGFACYLAAVALARRLPRRALWWAIVALVAAFVVIPPLFSEDVLLSQDAYSYIAYARLDALYGLNPYDAVPSDVPHDAVFDDVGWRDAVSAYGPVFSLATWPLGLIGVAPALWVLKLTGGLAVVGTTALAGRVAEARGGDARVAWALVGLNPLVLVHVVGGAHNDGLMMLAAMGAIAALAIGLDRLGGGMAIAAAGIKASGAFLLPFALLGARRPGRVAIGAAIAAIVIAVAGLAAYGDSFAATAGLVGENQALTSRYSIPSTLSRVLGVDVDLVRAVAMAMYGAMVLSLLIWVARGGDWVRAAGWAAFGLLLATAWMLPWYVIWVLPLAAIAGSRPLVGCTLALCAFQLINRVPM